MNGCLRTLIVLVAWTGIPVHGEIANLDGLPSFDRETRTCNRDWLIEPCRQPAALYRTEHPDEFVLSNGLLALTFVTRPNLARVGMDLLPDSLGVLRGVKPEARVTVEGREYAVGGLVGQPNYAYLARDWVHDLQSDPGALRLKGMSWGPLEPRLAWGRQRHHAPEAVWPPRGIQLRLEFESPPATDGSPATFRVSVNYELYEGIPVYAKWIEIVNRGRNPVRVDSFTNEILAAVEYSSDVEDREGEAGTPNVHVETDYAFLAMSQLNAGRFSIRWIPDPDYATQVNYERSNRCLLETGPEPGPAAKLAPGESLVSFRTWVLPFDSTERERKGLSLRRMYRTVAPWTTENPLMMHVRYSDWDTVRQAVDQAAEVGFEMVILTFGSGFNIENSSPEYLAEMRRYAEYAHSKGIEIGGYSLLASRSIDPDNDVVSPPGTQPAFGRSPCLGSDWGERYFEKLYAFFDQTGFDLLEHDGSYPGDLCAATHHPGHLGLEDSRWRQWQRITDFYKWARARGLYLNVPDWYFLSGSNKTGMGYRETNWSLPREQQVVHTRQNIYDGTWEKTPSMGWMFVPLTEYHGGGPAATIEPLDEHREHYDRMLTSNLALGVQACYRGPRLYDTDRVRDMVRSRVQWFKRYRAILESDLVHGRRADGRDLDWMLHVNPQLDDKGMLVVFNPLDQTLEREIEVDLYYTGVHRTARVIDPDGVTKEHPVDRDYRVKLPVTVPAGGFTWLLVQGE